MKRLLTTLTVAAVLLGTAACSSGEKKAENEETKPTETAAAPAVPESKGEIPDIPTGGTGVFAGLQTSGETAEPGTEVMANGTFTMPEGLEGDVFISVSWVEQETSSVYARGVQTLEGLTSGETASWQVSASLPADAVNVITVKGATLLDK